jgi:hypothetical protein
MISKYRVLEVSDKQIQLLLYAIDVYVAETNNKLDKEEADVYQRLKAFHQINTTNDSYRGKR